MRRNINVLTDWKYICGREEITPNSNRNLVQMEHFLPLGNNIF